MQTEAGEASESVDPGRDFAAMMSSAAAAAAPDLDAAPFGWTTDRKTGERRPKRAAGRPRTSPSIDELRTVRTDAEAAGGAPGPREPDRAPAGGRRRSRDTIGGDEAKPADLGKPGMITKGVNRLYRRAGKIVKAMDSDIGTAIIESTKNTADKDEPDDSVGAAWEEVCKTNPRIRRFVLRCLAGGAWSQLIMAHAPILLAILLKDGIRKRLPMSGLLEAFLTDDEPAEDGPPSGIAGLMEGMTPDDLQQLTQLAKGLMNGMTQRAAA